MSETIDTAKLESVVNDVASELPGGLPTIPDIDGDALVNKMKYLGMQINTMDEKEKVKFTDQFQKLSKSLNYLRKVIKQKVPDDTWHTTVWICVTVLVLIYAFFGYKLYKSLVERDRKREEKKQAKQIKKKK